MEQQIARHATPVGRDLLGAFPALVIQGARQVGKSTLAAQIVADRPARILTLDDRATRDSAVADEVAFVNQFPEGTLVIDEVQREPELLLSIKASIDRDRRPGRFLLTGSADLLSVKGRSDSLAGRAATLHLRGFSQGELADRRDDFVDAVLSGAAPLAFRTDWTRHNYVTTLAQGSFPELRRLPTSRLRRTWLESYLQRVLSRDAVLLPSGGQSARLRSVLSLVAASQGGELVKARLASDGDIPKNTITAYLDVLAAVFLVDDVAPWAANLTKREVGRRKAHVADSALAMMLNRLTEEQLLPLASDAIGGLFEAFVVSELLKQRTWSKHEFEPFHFRDRDGIEVDLVLELADGRVIGIEIKSSSTYRAEQFAGLRFLRDRLGDRFVAGFVLGMADGGYQYADRLYGLPASALWCLSGAVEAEPQPSSNPSA